MGAQWASLRAATDKFVLLALGLVSKLAHLMQSAYQRLKHNVQFVDLQDKEVVGCQRMENGVVSCKRKRNACVESV